MTVFLYDTFVRDIHEHGDSGFAQRVFRKLFNPNGTFRSDGEDHRFDGIENAWIRYVSGGATAYRAIYIREGDHIYLYRTGEHSIEDNLGPPRGSRALLEVDSTTVADAVAAVPAPLATEVGNAFRQNGRGRLLRSLLLGRRLFPHKEIMIISPFLTLAMFERTHRVGEVLDQLREDGAKLALITRPPSRDNLDFFRELEVRGWDLMFHQTLHSKLYIFRVDCDARYIEQGASDVALLGSANFTDSGFGLSNTGFNEELCYELPKPAHEGAIEYAYQLAMQSKSLDRVRRTLNN